MHTNKMTEGNNASGAYIELPGRLDVPKAMRLQRLLETALIFVYDPLKYRTNLACFALPAEIYLHII